ncbi:2-oxo acid dehydrogenase subunit E2 [uncultured Marinobacter sp.]|uniref:2-oxo acid dehydrogenase subunit E2 n=1 Tax=uncultured Marinobacter sp. TaxID=187379 RepID=UPI0025E0A312|nr:2-oxo acid dehydrogenase subunit E2 [uncultured Marinobacter sp.]
MTVIRLSEDQLEGTVATFSHWLVEVNTVVQEGDPIAELETDKVTMELAAPASGYLKSTEVSAGDEVTTNSILGYIESEDAPASRNGTEEKVDTSSQSEVLKEEAPLIDITLEEGKQEGTTAVLASWLVQLNEQVDKGAPIAELETDKVTMEIGAPAVGSLSEIIAEPGADVVPGEVLARFRALSEDQQSRANLGTDDQGDEPVQAAHENVKENAPQGVGSNEARHLVGPAVRRMVAEHDLDLSSIPGTGRGGRVTRGDVVVYLKTEGRKGRDSEREGVKRGEGQPATRPETGASSSNTPRAHSVPHSAMRKSIASHMQESLQTAPHVTSVFEMDMTNLIDHRRWHKKEYSDEGVNLTFTAYFLAALVDCFKLVPQMNARFYEDRLEIFDEVNIGVGAALGDEGLVVPVIRNVENMRLFDIARSLDEMTDKARKGKLTRNDMSGGTFTISNHGVSGSLLAAPIIINQPQVAILGVGKMEKRVQVEEVNGEDVLKIRPMCYVTLTIDHRAVDAHQTNRFLSKFVECINDWGS